jgi:DNA-directed RNA polymerase specialized sigma24 family protein
MARLKGYRARAALVLFKAGFSFAEIAQLLNVRRAHVMTLVRASL